MGTFWGRCGPGGFTFEVWGSAERFLTRSLEETLPHAEAGVQLSVHIYTE